MAAYAIRRLLQTLPLLLIGTFLVYNLTAISGDPLAERLATCAPPACDREALIARFDELYNLSTPPPLRYFQWLGGAVTLDFGVAPSLGEREIGTILGERLLNTAVLAVPAFLIIATLAVAIGVFQAVKQYSVADYVLTGVSFLGISIPTFVFGLFLQVLFTTIVPDLLGVSSGGAFFRTQGFPRDGILSLDMLRYGTLPILTLVLVITAAEARFERASMLEVINSDYIRTARAKGLSERVVIFKHALRNALIPLVTVWALDFSSLLTGSVVTETIFAWPGMGRLLLDQGIGQQDLNVMMAVIMVFALTLVAFNLLADILYGVLDPRIRYD